MTMETSPVVPRRTKLWIGGGIVVAVIAYLIVSGMQGMTSYYLTVEELRAEEPSNRVVRVSGFVRGGSIDVDASGGIVRFVLADRASGESRAVDVVYHGPPPDMLRPDAEAIVEGRYAAQGLFEADELYLKCPSRYEAAATATARP